MPTCCQPPARYQDYFWRPRWSPTKETLLFALPLRLGVTSFLVLAALGTCLLTTTTVFGGGALKVCSDTRVFRRELAVRTALSRYRVGVFPELLGSWVEPWPSILMPQLQGWEEVLDCDSLGRAVEDVRSALRLLWGLGLCHNDVKPDNVRFHFATKRFILCDFSHTLPIGARLRFPGHALVWPRNRGTLSACSVEGDSYSFARLTLYWDSWLRERDCKAR